MEEVKHSHLYDCSSVFLADVHSTALNKEREGCHRFAS
jgi:hypothetical protein